MRLRVVFDQIVLLDLEMFTTLTDDEQPSDVHDLSTHHEIGFRSGPRELEAGGS